MKLSNNIIAYRKRLGFSQEKLAEQIGVSRQAVSKWETAEATPDLEHLAKLAQVLNVSVDQLMNDMPSKQEESNSKSSGLAIIFWKYGWLIGVVITGYGLLGLISVFTAKSAFNSFVPEFSASTGFENVSNSIFGIASISYGVIILVGILITVLLLKKRKKYC